MIGASEIDFDHCALHDLEKILLKNTLFEQKCNCIIIIVLYNYYHIRGAERLRGDVPTGPPTR